LAVAVAKGPEPRNVCPIAIPDNTAISVAASRGLNRNAAQTRGGVDKNVRGNVVSPKRARSCPNTARPRRIVDRNRPAVSSGRPRGKSSGAVRAQRTKRGVMIRAPVASPSHQVSQMRPKSAQFAYPPSARHVTPVVALRIVLSPAARPANLKTS
jgi:hypothetical protein